MNYRRNQANGGSIVEWRDLAGYESHYQISSEGSIRSKNRSINYCNGRVDFKRGSLMRPKQRRDGYQCIQLCKNGKSKTFYVHRLVAGNFLANPYHKAQVNHKNMIRNDNRVVNLEWVTEQENIDHAVEYGNTRRLVRSRRQRPVYVAATDTCYLSIRIASQELNLSYGHLNSMLGGKRLNTVGIEYCA